MNPLFAAFGAWLFREVMAKFIIFAVVYLVITMMIPLFFDLAGGFLGVNVLTTAFSSLSPGVWYFLDFARLDVGLPALLSVAVTLFILRRVPFLNVR